MNSIKNEKSLRSAGQIKYENDVISPVTALLSERSLARDWLKPEEDRAWDYL